MDRREKKKYTNTRFGGGHIRFQGNFMGIFNSVVMYEAHLTWKSFQTKQFSVECSEFAWPTEPIAKSAWGIIFNLNGKSQMIPTEITVLSKPLLRAVHPNWNNTSNICLKYIFLNTFWYWLIYELCILGLKNIMQPQGVVTHTVVLQIH